MSEGNAQIKINEKKLLHIMCFLWNVMYSTGKLCPSRFQ
ncbi:hypothetical protein JCM19301_3715 [Jejuia pallidilutea]|uniref:Uncharacterized protein n=1 Tax=Jejuia pallidilutea TaxID=504487 RepID=A0A090VKF6_9FLAO|nr:hypothetical protein JCM19301_3715 [Jejuia pallidilutea]GAL69309.1 hypothetical protein JCM19302_4038 [Jejuia pallidilutea]GAL89155.1 hypothetical protein JCM19538_2144 [Jejuia pallidilutea]